MEWVRCWHEVVLSVMFRALEIHTLERSIRLRDPYWGVVKLVRRQTPGLRGLPFFGPPNTAPAAFWREPCGHVRSVWRWRFLKTGNSWFLPHQRGFFHADLTLLEVRMGDKYSKMFGFFEDTIYVETRLISYNHFVLKTFFRKHIFSVITNVA